MATISELEQLREYDTALLANLLGYIDPIPAHAYYMSGEVQSVTPSLGPTVGVAVTCKIDASTPEGEHEWEPYWEQVDAMAAMGLPSVWVVETVGSRPAHECIMGDGMAKVLYAAGCVGAVTSGGVRDVAGLLTVPFAAYCRGTVIHHCAVRMKAMDVPVSVGGITVEPGEIIHAGAEGVIKIPERAVGKALERAPAMRLVEHEVHAMWRRGDLSTEAKRRGAAEIIAKHGF